MDYRIKENVKGRVYKVKVRPIMMCGTEAWAVKKVQENKLDVKEMKKLSWMRGVTTRDNTEVVMAKMTVVIWPRNEKRLHINREKSGGDVRRR